MDAIEEKLRAICNSAFSALWNAHILIDHLIKGDRDIMPLLEGYFASMDNVLDDAGRRGMVIRIALDELVEVDWNEFTLEIKAGELHLVKDKQL